MGFYPPQDQFSMSDPQYGGRFMGDIYTRDRGGIGGIPRIIGVGGSKLEKLDTGYGGRIKPHIQPLTVKPKLEIVEQPKSHGIKFHYEFEDESHEGLPGENSEKTGEWKTFPTVRLVGYRGRARVMVSLVSDSDPPIPHAHSIVCKNTIDGRYVLEMGPETGMYAVFPNIGIQRVIKKKVPDVLTKRLLQQLAMKDSSLDQLEVNTDSKFTDAEKEQVKTEVQRIAKSMNLSVVRLCFQAFLMDEHSRFTTPVEPVFSHKVYDSNPMELSEELLDEALKEGYVRVCIIMCLLLGMAGVGKTCLKHLLLELLPPQLRDSTPLADRPTRVNIRPVSGSKMQVDKAGGSWKEVSEEKLLDLVAEAIPDSVPSTSSEAVSKPLKPSPATVTSPQALAQNANQLPSSIVDEVTCDRNQQNSPTQILLTQSPEHSQHVHEYLVFKEVVSSIEEKLMQQIPEFKRQSEAEKGELFSSKWVYLTDSGGQPQFHHLFPLFVHKISAALFVIRLPERLDSYPLVEYYKGSKRVGIPQHSALTTLDTLKCLLHSIQSCPKETKELTKIFVVGTRKDEMEGSECAAINEANEKLLRDEFSRYSNKVNLVYYNQQQKKIIFPVNCANPGDHEEKIAKEIQKKVESSAVVIEAKVPISYYVLELILRQLAKKLGRGVFQKSECLEIAQAIKLSAGHLNAALEFFDKLCIFHYYPDTLPEVVFVDSQVPVDKITELVEHSFLLRQPLSNQVDGTAIIETPNLDKGDWERFRDHGVISLQILQNDAFSSHYIEGVFSPLDLLKLLQKLLVVAPLADLSQKSETTFESETVAAVSGTTPPLQASEFLMPSLLEPVIEDVVLEQHRIFSSNVASPLLIRFSDNLPRVGVFCCLVVFLMKQDGWKLSSLSPAVTVARNVAKFRVRIGKNPPCKIVLIDSFSYIEVHTDVKAPPDECKDLFPTIKETVFSGIKAACKVLHYTDAPEPEMLFFCPDNAMPHFSEPKRCKLERHVATFIPGTEYLSCEEDVDCPGYDGKLESKHTIWLGYGKEEFLKLQASTNSTNFGKNTREYTVLRKNFDRLVNAVEPSIGTVARKAFAKELISHANKKEAENKMHSEEERASKLLGLILDRVEQNIQHFYAFVSILREIPTFKDIVNDLTKMMMM